MDGIEEFKGAMRAHALTPPEIIEPGKLHRFATNGKRHDDGGWCKLFADGGGGVFGDFRSGLSETWQAQREKPFTPAEREAFRQRCEAERRAREAEEDRRHAEAREKAAEIWKAATPAASDNPYLARKRISPVASLREIEASAVTAIARYAPTSRGDALTGRLLVVPVMVAAKLSTVEFINEAGRKSALYGGAKAGGYWAAQSLPNCDGAGLTLLIGEGVATVLSAREATGHLVIAALSSGNLLAVAREMRKRFSAAKLGILADLVKATGDPHPHAVEAARAVGGLLAIPDFGEDRPEDLKDLNDLAVLRGREAVKLVIASAKAPAGDEARPGNGAAPSTAGGAESGVEQARLQGVEIWVQSDLDKPSRLRPQADILIDIGRQVAQALFLGDDDRAYAVVRDRSEVWPIASKRFREWLRGCYFTKVGKGANANSARDAIDTIEAEARYSGDKRPVFLRVAAANGKIYIDLTDDDWRVVEIDAEGWRILDQSPVMFVRRGAPLPLPVPESGGSMSELWRLINVPEEARPLVAGWSLAALYPSGPYAILALQGEQGAAKSTTARMLRSLCDPSLVPLRAMSRDPKDFQVGCVGSWCVCIDNVSGMQPWMSDSLCGVSTGSGFASRELYTNCDEALYKVQRPVILNGIDMLAVRGDLVDRCVTVMLSPISDSHRLTEAEICTRFNAVRPRIFGALLTALAQVVRDLPATVLSASPRMADFAKLVVAAETALGFQSGEFMRAYRANISAGAVSTVEASPVAQAMITFMFARKDMAGRSEWTGTATELLDLLAPKTDDQSSRSASAWPRSGRGMISAFTRLAPVLRRVGIEVEYIERVSHHQPRRIRLMCRVSAEHAQHAQCAPPACNAGPAGLLGPMGADLTRPDTPNTPRTGPEIPNENNGGADGAHWAGLAGTLHDSDCEVL